MRSMLNKLDNFVIECLMYLQMMKVNDVIYRLWSSVECQL